MASVIRIMHQNFENSEVTAHEIKETLREDPVDVIVLHEPFTVDGKRAIGPLVPACRLIESAGKDEIPLTAIMIVNRWLTVRPVPELCSDRCVCVRILTEIGDIFLVSLYSPLSEPIEDCLSTLEELSLFLAGQQTLICVDANAKSMWWSNSDSTCPRGDRLEDAILRLGYLVVNRKDRLGSTYDGLSHSDLTLATKNILQRVENWSVRSNCTSSSRRTIWVDVFCLNFTGFGAENEQEHASEGEHQRHSNGNGGTRNENNSNEEFEDHLNGNGETRDPYSHGEHDDLRNTGQSGSANNSVFVPLNETLPFMKHPLSIKKKEIPWLNDSLKNMRRKVCRMKKVMEQIVDRFAYERAEYRFKNLRKVYIKKLRQAKIKYVRQFEQGEPGEWCYGWKKTDEDTDLNSQFRGPLASFDGSTSSWSQDPVVISDRREKDKDNRLNENNNNDE